MTPTTRQLESKQSRTELIRSKQAIDGQCHWLNGQSSQRLAGIDSQAFGLLVDDYADWANNTAIV